jgi:hypothetical protein
MWKVKGEKRRTKDGELERESSAATPYSALRILHFALLDPLPITPSEQARTETEPPRHPY